MAGVATPPALARDLAVVVARLRESTVEVRTAARAGGAGVIWRADGLIVTCAHVVMDRRRAGVAIEVGLANGRRYPATLVELDHRVDLALLRIAASDLPAARVGDARRLRPGELVLAIGHPFGVSGAAVTGVVHATSPDGRHSGSGWIQADLRLAPGNSGGPIADAAGRVVGVNAMMAGGLALAVPSHAVEAFARRTVPP